MNNIQIFVEGVADQKFLKDLIHEWYGIKLTKGKFAEKNSKIELGDIFDMGGKDSFEDPTKMHFLDPIIETLQIEEIPMLLIFDADKYSINKPIIEKLCIKRNFHYFLLPYNGTHPEPSRNDGDLETLLQEVICSENQIIFDCWQAYEECLKGRPSPNTASGIFTLPARKTKIYAYLEALVGESKNQKNKIKEEHRDYRNPKHWNLAPTHPPLKPLKDFLDPFFNNQ
ncbi:DUF3226 domain-containing protein [Spirosoma linguale]|uniref:DUF4276 family protein n=1 Tax=Spirosoma linguale (strain ATCC 33905 / DSM 74 / LMG 10896 / Claus 1) TaxID=504472 RepID=D2QK69_SPILD|nr:conserved hypothetical protein [Spirosoma linguale DSM 74]